MNYIHIFNPVVWPSVEDGQRNNLLLYILCTVEGGMDCTSKYRANYLKVIRKRGTCRESRLKKK